MHTASSKKDRCRCKPDIGMGPNVDALTGDELHRPHLIEEDKGTDHLAPGVGSARCTEKPAAQIPHARGDDQVEHIARPVITKYRVLRGHPAHCVVPSSRLRRKVL
jgi:hypothetical protein